jgi:predicted nucleic acid-binding protein
MKKYVLDTSALFSLVEDEAGKERVAQILQKEEFILPFITLLEIHYITQQEQGLPEADRRYAILKQANVLWSFDEPTLLTAARVKAENHISLADSMVAAVAIQNNAILVHKDPEYECLSNQLELEALPYKK